MSYFEKGMNERRDFEKKEKEIYQQKKKTSISEAKRIILTLEKELKAGAKHTPYDEFAVYLGGRDGYYFSDSESIYIHGVIYKRNFLFILNKSEKAILKITPVQSVNCCHYNLRSTSDTHRYRGDIHSPEYGYDDSDFSGNKYETLEDLIMAIGAATTH